MRTLFNDDWLFSEYEIDYDSMYKDGKKILFTPDQFYDKAEEQVYENVNLPHDWMIFHVNDLYKNSVGFYRKKFTLYQGNIVGRYNAIRFEGIYMNSAVWIDGEKAGEWKYGYSTFEFDISEILNDKLEGLHKQFEILVIVVYQNCNTRWYSGAGIFRDVYYINTPKTYLVSDGIYFSTCPQDKKTLNDKWIVKISSEIAGDSTEFSITHSIIDKKGKIFAKFENDGNEYIVQAPHLWDVDDPYFYYLKTELKDVNGILMDKFQSFLKV